MNRPVSLDTTMVDVNDDCLLEIFAHFDEKDLCEAADTCKRFRSVAQRTFRTSKFKTMDVNGYFLQYYSNQKLRLLRTFGENIESIKLSSYLWEPFPHFFEYVGQYCGETLESLKLDSVRVTDDIAYNLQPAIRNLRELRLDRCAIGSVLRFNLHSWSQKLLDLEFNAISQQIRPDDELLLRQKFPQLQSADLNNVNIDDIEAFLRLNPQLKKMSCSVAENSIFRLVAAHVPTIEYLRLPLIYELIPENMTDLNKLRSLKSFEIWSSGFDELPAIQPANCQQLEILTLRGFNCRLMGTELTRLTNLKELKLWHVENLTVAHIIDTLVECRQLRRLHLDSCYDLKLSIPNLLDILRYGGALNEFYNFMGDELEHEIIEEERVFLDADSYSKMVNIVKFRPNTGMTMSLDPILYVNNVPESLLAEHRNVLEINHYVDY